MSYVLRFRRSEDPAAFVIINTQQNGPSPLDLRVVGTDGVSPFITEVKQENIQKWRSSKNGTDEEWILVLSTVLLQQDAASSVVQGLETVASLSRDESELVLSIRKNIGGITQRLGAITLTRNDEEELDIVQWAGIAAQNTDDMRSQLTQLNSSLLAQQDTIKDLTSQLDALVIAKKTHEEELLKKFAALLNAKKLKIRDQQRLLAKAKVDPKAAEEVKQARVSSSPVRKTRTAGTSRSSKRKANVPPPDSETDDEEDFQTASRIARIKGESTPEKSEPDETEDDTDADGFDSPPVASQASRRIASQSQIQARNASKTTAKASEPTVEDLAAQEPPPRRELPFAKKPAINQQPTHQPATDRAPDEDTESDDDEL